MSIAHKIVLLTLVMLLGLPAAEAAAKEYSGPDDPVAVAAAQRAVERLGPGRGAILYSGRSVALIGIPAIAFAGESADLEQLLTDLGAKSLGTEIQVSLSGDVLFDFDKWHIMEKAEGELTKLAQAIRELEKTDVRIEGHTDAIGSESYNEELSQKRADSVRDWLVARGGVTGVQFQTVGYGEAKPVAPNTKDDGSDNPEGRALNRRVEIFIR